MKKTGWKITAITALIMLVFVISFTTFLVIIGNNLISTEAECSINVCSGADTFYYDYAEKVCFCYIDDELVSEEYIG